MKLLPDENQSRRIVPSLQAAFPGSTQIALLGLESVLSLIEEIVVENDEAIMRGSYASLAVALYQMKMGTSVQVPTFMRNWCARRESNPRPLASETKITTRILRDIIWP